VRNRTGTKIIELDPQSEFCNYLKRVFYLQKFLGEKAMLGTVLIVILILLLIGVIPSWPHSAGWGYGPSGILGTILIIVLILWLLGRL